MMKTKYIDILGYIFIFLFNVLVPPFQADKIEWILDLDKDSRLLIIENNRTYSLCGNNWTNEYATAVCRHLNRSDNGIAGVIPRNTNLSQIPFGQDSCPVNFTNLFECKSDNTNAAREICNFTGDASVTCYNEIEWILDLDKDSRLLIIENNRTYSLCGNNWTNEYATAVCRHLNRSDNGIAGVIPRNTNLSQIPFGQDSCPLNFTNLLECKSDNTNAAREICNFTGDASVTCYNEIEWILDLDKDSRLLIIENNRTYSLCGNNWTNEYATAVCRHLNRSDNGIAGVIPRNTNLSQIPFGQDSCPVNFTNLLECKSDNTNAAREICNFTGDASVTCYNEIEWILDLDKDSRLLIIENNRTYSLCGNNWTNEYATAVCRHLNRSDNGIAGVIPRNTNLSQIPFGQDSCPVNFTNLLECKSDNTNAAREICNFTGDASVTCYNEIEWILDLDKDSRLLIIENNRTYSLCGNNWTNEYATAVCRHLNRSDNGIAGVIPRNTNLSQIPFGQDSCPVNFTNLLECKSDNTNAAREICNFTGDASVTCYNEIEWILDLDKDSRLLIIENNRTYSLCGNNWTNEYATAVCRHLNRSDNGIAGVIPRNTNLSQIPFGQDSCPVNFTNLLECKSDNTNAAREICNFTGDASVTCYNKIEWILDLDKDSRLLIIENNRTYSLCGNNWTNEYATAVCRHLNRSDNGIAGVIPRNTNLSQIPFGQDSCPVNFTNLFECKSDNTNAAREICNFTGDASVTCYNEIEWILDLDKDSRLLIIENNRTYSLCGNNWTNEYATAVCRHLNRSDNGIAGVIPRNTNLSQIPFGQDSCPVNFTNLLECKSDNTNAAREICNFTGDASVTCYNEIEWILDLDKDSRLLIIENNRTYSLCGNNWTNEYATAVCRHLNRSDNGIAGVIPRNTNLSQIPFGQDSCPVNFTNLLECKSDNTNAAREICNFTGDASVTCYNEIEWILDLDKDSRLLIIENNRTYSLCGNNWTNEYATAVCRHLNRSDNGIAGVIPRNTNLSQIPFGQDSCPVNFTNLLECKSDNTNAAREICNFTGDASVTCYNEIEWILDLDKDSRLLIIENNRTYSLCGNNWTNEYATAVCRHLNRSDNGIAGVIPRNTNLSQIPFGQDSCPVNFKNLLECKSDNTNAAREICNFIGDASVTCYNNSDSHFSDNTDLCINIIAVGATSFTTFIIFLLVIIYIQRRKLVKASYTTFTVRRDENNYKGIPHQMSDSTTEHYYEESSLSVIPTSKGQSTAHQNIDQIQHVDSSGCLILSNTMETGGDHYHSIAN